MNINLTTRKSKESPLTHTELDDNWMNIEKCIYNIQQQLDSLNNQVFEKVGRKSHADIFSAIKAANSNEFSLSYKENYLYINLAGKNIIKYNLGDLQGIENVFKNLTVLDSSNDLSDNSDGIYYLRDKNKFIIKYKNNNISLSVLAYEDA